MSPGGGGGMMLYETELEFTEANRGVIISSSAVDGAITETAAQALAAEENLGLYLDHTINNFREDAMFLSQGENKKADNFFESSFKMLLDEFLIATAEPPPSSTIIADVFYDGGKSFDTMQRVWPGLDISTFETQQHILESTNRTMKDVPVPTSPSSANKTPNKSRKSQAVPGLGQLDTSPSGRIVEPRTIEEVQGSAHRFVSRNWTANLMGNVL